MIAMPHYWPLHHTIPNVIVSVKQQAVLTTHTHAIWSIMESSTTNLTIVVKIVMIINNNLPLWHITWHIHNIQQVNYHYSHYKSSVSV